MAEYQMAPQQGMAQPPPPPKPPRKNPYHDGMSSSAQHYDLFETIRRPYASTHSRPPDPPPRPYIGFEPPPTKQQIVNQKVKVRFEKQGNHLPRLRFLENVAKWLFYLFIFPPYFLLFRLPEIVEKYVVWAFSKLLMGLKNLYHHISQRIVNYWARQVERFKNFCVNPLKYRLKAFQTKVIRIKDAIWNFPRNLLLKLKTMKANALAKVRFHTKSFKSYLIQQWSIKVIHPLQRLVSIVKSPFQHLAEYIENQKKRYREFIKQVKKRAESFKDRVLHPLVRLKSAYAEMREALKRRQKNFEERVNRIKKEVRKFLEKIKINYLEKLLRTKSNLKRVLNYPKAFLLKVKKIFIKTWLILIDLRERVTKKIKEKGIACFMPLLRLKHRLQNRWILSLSSFIKIFLKGRERARKSLTSLTALPKLIFKFPMELHPLKSLRKNLLEKMQRPFVPFFKLAVFLYQHIQNGVENIRFTLAWGWILCLYSMEQVRILSDKAAFIISIHPIYT